MTKYLGIDPGMSAAYLAAMIDGEGSVSYDPNHYCRQIKIVNTDDALIEACGKCCEALGIIWSTHQPLVRRTNLKQQTVLTIYGQENLKKVWSLVPIQAPKKRQKLEEMVGSYKRKPNKRAR